MNLYLKQHVFTWGDKFTLYDEAGNERYYVEGEVFSWGKKLHIFDLNGSEAAFIRQKVFSFLPRYYISVGGSETAEVVRQLAFFRQSYYVNGLGWSVNGDFFAHEYEILENGRTVASVSKRWFALGDAYEISIASGVDEVAALAIVLVIDACLEASQND